MFGLCRTFFCSPFRPGLLNLQENLVPPASFSCGKAITKASKWKNRNTHKIKPHNFFFSSLKTEVCLGSNGIVCCYKATAREGWGLEDGAVCNQRHPIQLLARGSCLGYGPASYKVQNWYYCLRLFRSKLSLFGKLLKALACDDSVWLLTFGSRPFWSDVRWPF